MRMPTNTVEKIYMKVQYDYKYSSYSIYIVCSVVEYSGLREHPVRVVRATRSVLREPPFPVVRATRIIELRTVVFCTNLL